MISLLLNPHERPSLTRSHCRRRPTPEFQDILEQSPPCAVFARGDGSVCRFPPALFLPMGTSGKRIFSPGSSQIFCWLKYHIDTQKLFHLFCSTGGGGSCALRGSKNGVGGALWNEIFRPLFASSNYQTQLTATWLLDDRRPVFWIYSFTEVTLFILGNDEVQASS